MKMLLPLTLVATCAMPVFAGTTAKPAVAPAADLTGGQFTTGCGNATAAPIFNAALMNSGLYGESNLIVVSDPDIVLIGNQWWMIFATGPTGLRAIQPFAAYLPPGASLSTTTTYPSDPNGWRLVGAQAGGGFATPTYGYPGANGWDQLAAETPSVNVNADGTVSIYYSGHNAGQTPFQIGLQTNFVNGQAQGVPNPVMGATQPWEYSAGLPALLEQSVRWIPSLNKYVMYYTAGAWWASPAPDNDIAYAESTDGVNWVNRQPLGFPVAYYNQDFLYNEQHNRFEMVISHDRTGAGGGNPRDIVWREAATAATTQSAWVNETTLLLYSGEGFISSGILSPSMKYGNLPGEENRLYVFFHSYDTAGNMYIGRFYCDATPSTVPTFSVSAVAPGVLLEQNGSTNLTFNVNAQAGFNSPVNFSVSGAPAGVTAALSQSTSTTGTTLALAAQPDATPGRYPIVVSGTSGSITKTSTFTLTVTQPPSFTLTPSAATVSLAQGVGTAALNVNVAPQNGFTGTVNFSATGFPATVNNSFLPTSSATGSNLVIYVQPATVPGKYPITVTGTSGSLTETGTFTLIVTGPPTFSLTPAASTASVAQGALAALGITVNEQNGFTGTVNFSASGFPAGVTGTFGPTSSASATSLSIAASATAAPGQYPITVTGTSGSLTEKGTFTLIVTGPPTFSLTPAASATSVTQGAVSAVGITVNEQNGFTGAVNFSASGFPAGVTGTFSPASSASATGLSIAAAATAAPGQYPITVTGTSGTRTQTTTITLTVAAAPSFTLSPATSSISLVQGTGTSTTVNVTPSNGFSGSVAFSATGFPSTVNNTFLQATSTTGSTLVLYVQSTTAPGQYPITLTGTSGSLTETASLTLTVTAAVSTLTPQTITLNAVATALVGQTGTLAPTSTSGLPVTLTSNTPSVCTLSGYLAKAVGPGTCTLVATQAGNATYAAATPVTVNITVYAGYPQQISWGAVPSQVAVGASGTLPVSASSGLPVTITSSTPSVCTVSGLVATTVGTGTCTLVATQAGNSNYAAAAPASISITVVSTATAAKLGIGGNTTL